MNKVSDSYVVEGYFPTIGIECHVQLKTSTKLFAAISNDARDAQPNSLISHICFGLPGALPVMNEQALILAMKAAFALNSKPQKFSKFDRKHYFYPDLPLGYQITQFDEPIIVGGHMEIFVNDQAKRIGITRAHLEADAGKSSHPAGEGRSLVDLNRAGTPLLEIVSEPDIHNAAEARAYAKELYLAMKHAEVSDVDLYHGNMRFDVNVSVSKDPEALGTRTETKNLNSFRSVEKTVEYEIKRQIKELEAGGQIVQETRGWDDDAQKTFSQRTKEDAHDYRYFPDPDLPPMVLSDEDIEAVASTMPLSPAVHREALRGLGIDESQIDTIVGEPIAARYISDLISKTSDKNSKTIVNWFSGPITKYIADGKINWTEVISRDWVALANMTTENKISSTGAKEILNQMISDGGDPQQIADDKGLMQVSDSSEIEKIVDGVIASNESAANDVRNGEMKAIGFLVGQVMKVSQGKANPGMAKEMLIRKLS